MAFDTDQPSYTALRKILSERTRQVVVFCGAGLSRSAQMPSWSDLRKRMIASARKEIAHRTATSRRDDLLLTSAEHDDDFWAAFQTLKRVMLDTFVTTEIRAAFDHAGSVPPPQEYVDLWKLPLGGFVTLNIDGFVSRAFAEVYGGKRQLREFPGIDCDRHSDVFTSGHAFVVNLHGSLTEAKSWVFAADDLRDLMDKSAYRQFLQSLFTTRTVLFIGITADDPAIAKHLEVLQATGFSGGEHFWVTHRTDTATVEWADRFKVRLIYYSAADNHSEIRAIVQDISRWVPRETEPPPVAPSTDRERGFAIAAPEEIERLSAEEIRSALNKEASRILAGC